MWQWDTSRLMMNNCSHPLTAPPSVIFPEVGAIKKKRITWLIQLCTKHVKKYVMLPKMTTIVNQTDELSQRTNQRHPCRIEGCQKSNVCHGRRVRQRLTFNFLSYTIDVCIPCYSTSTPLYPMLFHILHQWLSWLGIRLSCGRSRVQLRPDQLRVLK